MKAGGITIDYEEPYFRLNYTTRFQTSTKGKPMKVKTNIKAGTIVIEE
ncbi:MAG: hypothetical protein JST85_04060 [Acidobacteria bacterium]|nr:hypothetical protein [Acidobacteriota bacterium]